MSSQLPPAAPSAVASLLCCCVAFGSLQVYKDELASSVVMRAAGGVVSSFIFFFAVLFVSNVLEMVFRERFGIGWLVVLPCLLAGEAAAVSVDVSCVYSCFASSVGLLWYLNAVLRTSTNSDPRPLIDPVMPGPTFWRDQPT
eukprot:CAMPEP_0196738424 /NCGR_PEP_ID=MMETSP1091-20130531/15804_1 /TAXON_ID=302021 /ORGANISM="Rhodomonas sp., Strain CCMP768" /LENGTH=141 /DNA_ID=CAMNT_0042082393 /DNA_START=1 /DNA_END=427 /DNA_ORIENTATION=-